LQLLAQIFLLIQPVLPLIYNVLLLNSYKIILLNNLVRNNEYLKEIHPFTFSFNGLQIYFSKGIIFLKQEALVPKSGLFLEN